MSAFDRFRAPGTDLATFFRSLVTPTRSYAAKDASSLSGDWQWEEYRARQGGSKHLDFFDHGLRGAEGSRGVLEALKQNPGAASITLSQNELGDDGVRALLHGLKQLRAQGIGNNLQELNLSGNGLTDVSLHLLALHLLLPSPAPPSLTHLFLTANRFSLESSELIDFLGSTLSSTTCSLRCLSFTNNPAIGSKGLVKLLSAVKLGPGTQLGQLHFSICGLRPDCAEPIAQWLETPECGARLQVLCINGNNVSPAGVRRIGRAVASGLASSLLHLECLANDAPEDGSYGVDIERLEEWEEHDVDISNWRKQVDAAKDRNMTVLKETRLAALSLLSIGRILFAGSPREPEVNAGAIRRDVEQIQLGDGNVPSFESDRPFPFLRLPIELQVHVLRCVPLLKPSKYAHLYPPLPRPDSTSPTTATSSGSPSTATPATATRKPYPDGTLSSPLTETQFLSILAHCASSATLATEIRIASFGGRTPTLNKPTEHDTHTSWFSDPVSSSSSWNESATAKQADRALKHAAGWEEWFLRVTGCDRFARG